MKLDKALRVLLAVVILVVLLIAIAATLFLTDSALAVWEQLQAKPAAFRYAFLGLISLLVLVAVWLLWRFVIPRRRAKTSTPKQRELTAGAVAERMSRAELSGVDTTAAKAELAFSGGSGERLDIAIFGEVSVGKSSVISALLPGATLTISALGGSTTEVQRHEWTTPSGHAVALTDMPGISGIEDYDDSVIEEARRAHLVLFVCDSDLSRPDVAAIERLASAGKPLLIAFNKADQYTTAEIDQLLERMHERIDALPGSPGIDIVPISAGGEQQVLVRDVSGEETLASTRRGANIDQLILALNDTISRRAPELVTRREQALFALADEKLVSAEAEFRERRARDIVRSHTRKSVIGALAAVSPGSDIVIQGYLASSMIKALSNLYEQKPRDLDIEKFLDLSKSRVGKALPLTLAVAGNGLKAFPGIGTVTGGLVHAVAYGLIFDAIGRSLTHSLAAGLAFNAAELSARLETAIETSLEAGVGRIARLVLKEGLNEEGSGRAS